MSIHPATFPDEGTPQGLRGLETIEATLRDHVPEGGLVLDPLAGLGKVFAKLAARRQFQAVGFEIERAYFMAGETDPCVTQGDSALVGHEYDGFCDAVLTSPVYPNGVADNFEATDTSKRNTYIHRIRDHSQELRHYQLDPLNPAGSTPRSTEHPENYGHFCDLTWRVFERIPGWIKPDGKVIMVLKNTPQVDFVGAVSAWFGKNGLRLVGEMGWWPAHGLNEGENQENKEKVEYIAVFERKPPTTVWEKYRDVPR